MKTKTKIFIDCLVLKNTLIIISESNRTNYSKTKLKIDSYNYVYILKY